MLGALQDYMHMLIACGTQRALRQVRVSFHIHIIDMYVT